VGVTRSDLGWGGGDEEGSGGGSEGDEHDA